LQGAESTTERLRNFRSLVRDARVADTSGGGASASAVKALADFEAAMDDDFNTAAALAAVHDMVREVNTILANTAISADDRDAVLDAIRKFDAVLGVFGSEENEILDAEIENLIEQRQEARRNRDFARSDQVRDELAAKGIILEDTKEGVRWKRK
ncbi:MAG TPA: DALR domain-containing protein, partial [Pyrinomonadaceae bacterium]|nr:DALR domain-containing protein [Pyrinomonadaceae bacterium]